MKRIELICMLIIVLFSAQSVNISVSPSNSGDLIAGYIYPVQVVSPCKAVIVNKASVIVCPVTSTFTTRVWVKINVTYNFGTKWYLETGPDGNGVPIDPGNNYVYIPGGPVYTIRNPDAFPWIPPYSPPWLYWNRTGLDDKIEAIIDPFDEIIETNETNNLGCTGTPIEVVKTKELKIMYAPVHFPDDDSDRSYPELEDIEWQNAFISSVFPIADDGLEFAKRHIFESSEPPSDEGWIYENIVMPLSVEARVYGYDRVVIVVNKRWGGWSGYAIGMLREPENRVPVIVVNSDMKRYVWDGYENQFAQQHLVAHELGHTYYLWHPHDIGPPRYGGKMYDVLRRDYGKNAWTFMSYESGLMWIDAERYSLWPKTWVDLSEYEAEVDGTWQWNLLDQFTLPEIRIPVIVVSGFIFSNGTANFDENLFQIPEGRPDILPGQVGQQEGDYAIVMLNKERQVISQTSFNASFTYLIYENGTLTKAETDVVPFIFSIPYTNETRFIQIRNAEGAILQERVVTANPPTVKVNFPNGGETLKICQNYTISWEFNDTDGDRLSYLISYSRDGGETWIPLASNINESHYVWNTSDLIPGDEYLIRVIATDGINTGQDISDETFSVLDLIPPRITNITQIPSGASVQSDQNVTVYANVYDVNSGVKTVSLSYRYSKNEGETWSPWINMTMEYKGKHTFRGIIPNFPQGTLIQYMIFAEDNSNNSITDDHMGEYYVYEVVPEFPSVKILLMLFISIAMIILAKRKTSYLLTNIRHRDNL